jgi:hypothetical protein
MKKETLKIATLNNIIQEIEIFEFGLQNIHKKMEEALVKANHFSYGVYANMHQEQLNKIEASKYAYNEILKTLLPI